MEQDLIADAGSQSIAHALEILQLEEHERQRLAVAPAVLHGVFQFGHQGGVVKQAGETVAMNHLPHSAPPGRPGDDGLDQELGVGAAEQEVIGAGSERRDAVSRALHPDNDDREETVADILPHQTDQGERIRLGHPGVQEQQVGALPFQPLLQILARLAANDSDVGRPPGR